MKRIQYFLGRETAITSFEEERGKKPSVDATLENFGLYVFNLSVMKKKFSKVVFQNILRAKQGIEGIQPQYADMIALAMKEWATSHGATHYSHWFQPLTGSYAEKHDAFIDITPRGEIVEKFSGRQLVQGEPDASSFPSGGLRTTYEARGYTGWDPSSDPFIWHGGDGITLCIPSVFFSWTGDVLDTKIPLLRSDAKINRQALRLLKHLKIQAGHVFSTLGLEQEYFVIDKSLRDQRPDLLLSGRTVFGAASPKGQELQDHYFGAVKDRILSFMAHFEEEAVKLGIPLKTRHNEVAPAQHEVAPLYEKASIASDHNILLMEIMRKVAHEHGLACLLHEKPFQGINGSGKHMNWSLSTDLGLNLLDPAHGPGSNLLFILMVSAILYGVHKHGKLLRASIGSASNDYRLGAHEAPPAIISVYLGKEVEDILERIEKKKGHKGASNITSFDLGILHMPLIVQDNTDRNRTSPFAFTGSKFEFRALGSSASPAFSATILNEIVAESLGELLDKAEAKMKNGASFEESGLDVARQFLIASKEVRFEGDNYSEAWVKEAKKRGLPNIASSTKAFESLIDPKTVALFKGTLNEHELRSRYEVMMESYYHIRLIEVNLMIDLFSTMIYPAVIETEKNEAKALIHLETLFGNKVGRSHQAKVLERFINAIEKALVAKEELIHVRDEAIQAKGRKKETLFSEALLEKIEAFRKAVDTLEENTADHAWPLPKYRELLFLV